MSEEPQQGRELATDAPRPPKGHHVIIAAGLVALVVLGLVIPTMRATAFAVNDDVIFYVAMYVLVFGSMYADDGMVAEMAAKQAARDEVRARRENAERAAAGEDAHES
ncbi:hypothetical protein [Actinosynnema pretiosum]|uniref:Uncharacterized protein n=1 Tax=Actinosynnema pretiosum TaxID=42197 RepID=A0A290Z0M7_9PSEU|nr:hypothetical protein [Actinosynnema pretiosum]ATE52581.1 hypothetical protein CNX65_04180 [Actinosynnema pretiosum]